MPTLVASTTTALHSPTDSSPSPSSSIHHHVINLKSMYSNPVNISLVRFDLSFLSLTVHFVSAFEILWLISTSIDLRGVCRSNEPFCPLHETCVFFVTFSYSSRDLSKKTLIIMILRERLLLIIFNMRHFENSLGNIGFQHEL